MNANPIARGIGALVRRWTSQTETLLDHASVSDGKATPCSSQMQIDLTNQFADPGLTELWALWTAKCKGGALPAKAAFTPRELARQLKQIAFLEIPEPGAPATAFRMGFMGSALTEIFGDCSGKTLGVCFSAPLCKVFDTAFGQAISRKAALRAHGMLTVSGRPHLAHETLVAPLANDGFAPDFVVTAICFTSSAEQR